MPAPAPAATSVIRCHGASEINWPSDEPSDAPIWMIGPSRPTAAPVPQNWAEGGYLERVPEDPWGRAYQYSAPGRTGPFDIYSLGADGQPGGEADNADIYSSEI